jgi:hypothetical protein
MHNKTTWTYSTDLRGCKKTSSTKIIQRFQTKTLRLTTNAPWHVSNLDLHSDLQIPFVIQAVHM